MPSYTNAVSVVHRQQSPKSQGFFKDDGCEFAPRCFACPLSRCKYDDRDWYRTCRKGARFLLIAETADRQGLSKAAAAARFGVVGETVCRAQRYRQLAERTLDPDDLAVFMGLVLSPPWKGRGKSDGVWFWRRGC